MKLSTSPTASLPGAIRELRKAYGETQQLFSVRMRMAISSLANYETGVRVPEPEMLERLYRAAFDKQRSDLMLRFAFHRSEIAQRTLPTHNAAEQAILEKFQTILFDGRYKKLRKRLERILVDFDALQEQPEQSK
jgi:transcriptional regulator with XRE-family HTH domain